MVLVYTFFASLFGIIILLSLKTWELQRGAKPFSVLRYRLDILMRRQAEDFKSYGKYISWTTARLVLAFLVAKTTDILTIIWKKWNESKLFMLIKGKIIPRATGPVSAFLKDVAEFKSSNTSSNGDAQKEISQTENSTKIEIK